MADPIKVSLPRSSAEASTGGNAVFAALVAAAEAEARSRGVELARDARGLPAGWSVDVDVAADAFVASFPVK